MAIDILESLNAIFGGEATRQLSTHFGDAEAGTRAGLRSGSSALLAALVQKATVPGGVSDIHRAVTSESVDPSLPSRLGSLLAKRGSFDPALGESAVNSILGNRSGSVAHALSEVAGIKPSSATGLLALAAPMLLSVLKKFVTQGSLDAGGLGSLLLNQRSALQRAGLDSRITNAMGFGNLGGMLTDTQASRPAADTLAAGASRPASYATSIPVSPPRRRWLPWAIAAALAVLVFGFLSTRFGGRDNTAQLAANALPTSVYFEVGQAALDDSAQQTIVAVATSVKASDVPVAVVGYTDPSGSPEQNLALAKNRADAVRDALVRAGVSESRVQMAAPASVTGTGSPDDARRVEIRVSAVDTGTTTR